MALLPQTFASRVALLEEEFLRSVFDGETNFPSRELPVDSFRSGEGFGSPYGINTSMRFRDVLTHIGARPGHYITQLIMEVRLRGMLRAIEQRADVAVPRALQLAFALAHFAFSPLAVL